MPRKLKNDVHGVDGHSAATVPEMGWAGTKNGALLRLAAPLFDAFLTMDAGIPHQQNLRTLLAGSALGVIVLRAASNRYDVLLPLVPRVLAVRILGRGDLIVIDAQAG